MGGAGYVRRGVSIAGALAALLAVQAAAQPRPADPGPGGEASGAVRPPADVPQADPPAPAAPPPAPPGPDGKADAMPDKPQPLLQPIPSDEVLSVLGKKVRSRIDGDLGMVVDVLIDTDGRPRAAVIDFGGFLGVGSRKVAVHWQALQFRPKDRAGQVILMLDPADVQGAPEYKPSAQPAEVVAPPASVPPPPAPVGPEPPPPAPRDAAPPPVPDAGR